MSTATTTKQPLPAYKAKFLQVCLDASILRFGSYTLKSGRVSPYFFNVGDFSTSRLTNALCTAYASCLVEHLSTDPTASGGASATGKPLEFDVLFGPAYKGCGLSYGTVMKLGELAPARFGDVGFCHDRKEVKDHGEGGSLVGASLKGKRVMIIDDVVTAGTAKRDAIDLIRREGGEVVGIVVALDRMEKLPKGEGGSEEDRAGERGSAIGQLRREYGIEVVSVLTLDDLIEGVRARGDEVRAAACEEYRQIYRASD